MMRRATIAVCWLVMAATALADPGDDAAPLTFFRVHVPHGKLADVDVGDERYVPMSAAEFSAGVARILGHDRAAAGPTALDAVAETARYVAELATLPRTGATPQPMLVGTAAWTMRDVGPSRSISLGGLQVGRAAMRTAAGTGDALVFGRPDGTLGIATPEPGEYDCEWQCGLAGTPDDAWIFRLPLVPALATSLEVRLPVGMRPFMTDSDTQPTPGEEAAAGMTAWRIDVGPRRSVTIMVVPVDAAAALAEPQVRVWSDVSLRGREARFTALVEPVGGWRPLATAGDGTRVRLAVPTDALVTSVCLRDADTGLEEALAWSDAAGVAEIEVAVPPRSIGYRDAVIVQAVAPVTWEDFRPLPLVTVASSAWAGGGSVIRCDPGLVVSRIETTESALVPPEVAARWPAPSTATEPEEAAAGGRPTRMFIEHQAAAHVVRMAVAPRTPTIAIGRLTVVDVAPGAVLGKATCELSVLRGEAFEVRGRLARGWVLDAVEAVTPTDPLGETPEWKVVRDGSDDVVRVAFAAAVSPRRGMTLRLSGHRAGVPPGIDVTSTDLDMVRLDGESDAAVLAVKTGPDMTIDLAGDEPPLPAADPALAGDASIRVRLPAGVRAAERVMRLVRRRPPVDVRTQVRITSRDGRLTESFTFECSPQRTEIDALLVHFSTVMDDRLEWSLLPPATGTLVARRIDPPDRRDGRGGEPIADSWLVELSSPARETVTIRAAATVPFTAATPVPLAWVEGAIRPAGMVSVREAGRFRPRLLNRRLEEMPPAGDAGEQAGATVAEFAFDPTRGRPDDPLPAAEIVPGGSGDGSGDDARAWAWQEANTMWCHASGVIEVETRFDLENHGRSSVMLSVPETLRVQGVRVNGERVAGGVSGSGGGEMIVELPVGQRFVEVVVQALAVHDARLGIWPIAASAVSLDVPILQRSNQLLVAPDVAVARVAGAYRVIDESPQAAAGWSERLLGASVRPMAGGAAADNAAASTGLSPSGSVVEGYRVRALVPVVGRRIGGSVWLVRRVVVEATMILAAAITFVVVVAVPASRAWLIPWICGLAAMGALWAAVPFDAVFRAACWAAVIALVLRVSRAGAAAAVTAAVAVLPLCSTPSAVAAEPLRVFLTPIEAGDASSETALVPEPLFRALARASVAPANVRVVAGTLAARLWSAGDEQAPPWRLTLDLEADAGGVFVFDPSATGGEVIGDQAILDGGTHPLQRGDGAAVRVVVPTAGRHRLELSIRPALVKRGDVEEAVAEMPCAAVGRLTLATTEDTSAVVCEGALPGGGFQVAERPADAGEAEVAFDVSRAARVRLSRPIDSRLRLAAGVRAAVSRNDVFWDLDACRVIATFDIDAGSEVVRSCVVETDPGLVPAGEDLALQPIGPHRYLLERPSPTRGRWTVQMPFRMSLADPVGVFAVPRVWIADATADTRTTLFVPAPDLTVNVTLPDGVTSAPREPEASLQGFSWQAEVSASPTVREDRVGQPTVRGRGRAVVMVERRQARPRATQQLQVEFGVEQVRLGLQARIDATSTVLGDVQIDVPPDCVIDRVELVEDRGLQAEVVERGSLDVRVTRLAPESLLLVTQRPRSGRFRLDIEARLIGRPAAHGAMPVMRAALAGSVPMTVAWRTVDGRGATMRASYGEPLDLERAAPAGDRAATGTLELAGGETALVYEVGAIEPVAVPSPPAVTSDAVMPAAARDSRVEWTDVFLDVDGRGRVWGKARFDLVTVTPTVQLALPEGMRLFEVLVDGRAAAAVPQEDGTWLVSLFGVRWPRSVVAVFAGDVAAGQATGAPFAMVPPQLVGLPCRQVAWTLRVAPGLTVRVTEPTRLADEATIAAARQAAAERLEDDFIRAIEESDPLERSRMTDFARLRRTGAALPIEEAWARSLIAAGGREVAHVLAEEPPAAGGWPPLVVRIDQAADPTAATRAMATLGVIGACAGAWNVAARRPLGRRRHAAWAVPLLIALAAVVWVLLFDPAWPGWAMLVAAIVLAALPRHRDRPAIVANEVTVTQFAPSATASRWMNASTRTFLTRDE